MSGKREKTLMALNRFLKKKVLGRTGKRREPTERQREQGRPGAV